MKTSRYWKKNSKNRENRKTAYITKLAELVM